MGLVNQVLPGPEVLDRAMELAGRIAANGPVAIREIKRTVRASLGLTAGGGLSALEDASKQRGDGDHGRARRAGRLHGKAPGALHPTHRRR